MGWGERWAAVGAGALLLYPCIYLMNTMGGASGSSRDRTVAAADRLPGGTELGSRASGTASGGEAGLDTSSVRRASTSAADASNGAAARTSRVYAFGASTAPSSGNARPGDASYRTGDPEFGADGRGFDPRDLAVLAEIIALNGLTEDSSTMDFDDGDGVLEPTELGNQVWCGSRLRVLQMGPGSFSTYGYTVRELPDTISNLEYLTVLESNATGLEKLPPSLGTMQDLQRVSAYGNRLREIPPEIAEAAQLEEVQFASNEIAEIPTSLQQKPGLKRLFVDGNPLASMPSMLVKQNQKVVRGELVVPSHEIGAFGSDCRPAS
jgi:hypothetical protein